ncbi:hypothetical protein QYE76_019657 [Lolium multiflorum]|uniref:F-box domain-containing protein n=1 Tax=Lolium multiflorum TaxID=4521 RepID=A0AAD8R4W4_LOLMU|nr:hypothetical protein QYE76_019657 [Lolium multiflorum]
MAPPPPPPLVDDVTAEILLLLPPDEPEHLIRAALVCKPWLRIIRDPGFRRSYRDLHGAPPLLGFLHRLMVFQRDPTARFASTTSMPEFPHPGSGGRRTRPLDCRHGRVLIHMLPGFLVWDPVTGDMHHLPPEPEEIDWLIYSAAVLCAVDGCDHLDCRGGPFRVVFVATHEVKNIILASVYSSETGAWSAPVCLDNNTCEIYARHVLREGRPTPYGLYYTPYLQPRRGALVGDAVYFTVREGNGIVKYDLGKDLLSMIDPPTPDVYYIALMSMDNNTSLGFACIQGSTLCMWSRKMDTEEAAEWVQYRAIELDKTILPVSVDNSSGKPSVVGFAEGVGVIFVSSGVGLFTIKLSSGQVNKVDGPGEYFSVLPYMSFYLPKTGNGGGQDATDLLHST